MFARFPSTMAAPLFPLSSSSSSALPAAASRCLCLQAARPPSPGHQAPPPGHQERQGPALTLTHTCTRTDTRSARRLPAFSPFLALPPRSLSALRASLRMRPQGGRRVELPPLAPPPPCEERGRGREREGGRDGGRQGGLLRKTKERQRPREMGGRDGDRTDWAWGETWMEGRCVGPGIEMPPSQPQAWCSGMSRRAGATDRDGEECSPPWRLPVSSNCFPNVPQISLPLPCDLWG